MRPFLSTPRAGRRNTPRPGKYAAAGRYIIYRLLSLSPASATRGLSCHCGHGPKPPSLAWLCPPCCAPLRPAMPCPTPPPAAGPPPRRSALPSQARAGAADAAQAGRVQGQVHAADLQPAGRPVRHGGCAEKAFFFVGPLACLPIPFCSLLLSVTRLSFSSLAPPHCPVPCVFTFSLLLQAAAELCATAGCAVLACSSLEFLPCLSEQ